MYTLKGKLLIKGTIKLITGLHIGTSGDFSAIGAVDTIVIRDSVTNKPMIPGSSLKGKMRYLLARTKYHSSLELENIKKEIDNSNIDVILNVKKFSRTMYYKMIGTSIMKILKAEYSEVLENINKNDK